MYCSVSSRLKCISMVHYFLLVAVDTVDRVYPVLPPRNPVTRRTSLSSPLACLRVSPNPGLHGDLCSVPAPPNLRPQSGMDTGLDPDLLLTLLLALGLLVRASNESLRSFYKQREGPYTRAISWFKAPVPYDLLIGVAMSCLLTSFLNVKALVGNFNQETAPGACSLI